MPKYSVEVQQVAKASIDYENSEVAIHASLKTMRTNIETAVTSLSGAAPNAFVAAKAAWERGAAKIDEALDEGAAALGQTAQNLGLNESDISHLFNGQTVVVNATAKGQGKRLGEGMTYHSPLDNLKYDSATVDDFRTSMTQCKNKLHTELVFIDGVANRSKGYWQAQSQENYGGWHRKWNTGFQEVNSALNVMKNNAATWFTNSNATETTNASMWG